MKVPLIAIAGPNTVNRHNNKQQVIIWSRGEKIIKKSPRTHCYYKESKNGEEYRVLGSDHKKKYEKIEVANCGALNEFEMGPRCFLDGVTKNESERICIEDPEFFGKFFDSEGPRTLGFDIETYTPDSTFPFGEKYPIVTIGVATNDGTAKAFTWDGESDKQCLKDFFNFVKEYDPDIIYGYNVVGYDIPQVEFRANLHKLNMAEYFNREGRKDKLKFEMGLKKNTVRCWGRIIVDVLNFTRRDYALSGIAKGLKNVAQFYGQDPKELDFRTKNILDYDIDIVEEYVISDCKVTEFLFNHYFRQHLFVAEVLKVPLEMYLNGPDSFITKILQGRSLFKQGILTLNKNKDRHPDITSFQAAHIDLYKPGFHRKNYKVDFKSMYPSIAMALNLGPDTTQIIGMEDYDIKQFGSRIESEHAILTIPDNVINKNIIIKIAQDRKSSLYTMSKQFKEMREPFKRLDTQEAKSRSNALKIMVNTFYGSNTNPYMTYGDLSVGIAITGVARWLIMGARKLITLKNGDVVVYIHTDGVNTSADIDVDWINTELQKAMRTIFPFSEERWIEVEKDTFKEGFWIQIGNYVLRKEDGSLIKHGSTFKSKSRSTFYKKVLNKLIDARLDNVVTPEFIDDLYDFKNYELEDFVQMRTMNKEINDYKTENDLIMQLAREAQKINMTIAPGTTFSFFKTNEGYKLSQQVDNIDDIDIKYHWDIISSLLQKFGLSNHMRRKPPITTMDTKQRQLLDFI
jgi:DNA polymerase elongation subunit (family B)